MLHRGGRRGVLDPGEALNRKAPFRETPHSLRGSSFKRGRGSFSRKKPKSFIRRIPSLRQAWSQMNKGGIRPESAAAGFHHRVARQSTLPSDRPDRYVLAGMPPPDHAQQRHVQHSSRPHLKAPGWRSGMGRFSLAIYNILILRSVANWSWTKSIAQVWFTCVASVRSSRSLALRAHFKTSRTAQRIDS